MRQCRRCRHSTALRSSNAQLDAPWAYLPPSCPDTGVQSDLGSRRMRCASAETARFEVALSLPERARSSPPRRLPPFNVARPASRASQPASQAFEVTVSRPHAGPPVGATTHPKAKGASHVK